MILEEHLNHHQIESFENVARQAVDRIDFGNQEYLRDHLYQIVILVKAHLDKEEA